jgi:hypothetical protein
MKNAQHTPGPWHIETYDETHAYICNDYGDVSVCAVPLPEAHLIAAAPAMLEALQYMVHLLGEEHTPGNILKTIAQATGGTEGGAK